MFTPSTTFSPAAEPAPLSSNPFEAARLTLIKRLLTMTAPKAYPAFPKPIHHQTVACHIREAAAIFDEWLSAIGRQVAFNANGEVDRSVFTDAFTAAIDGNATYECDRIAENMVEERHPLLAGGR